MRILVLLALNGQASLAGSRLQLRFQPGDKFVPVSLVAPEQGFGEVAAYMVAPQGSEQALVYLYCHRTPTPQGPLTAVSTDRGVVAGFRP